MIQLGKLWPFMRLGVGIFLVSFAGLLTMPANKGLVRLVARMAGFQATLVFGICISGTWRQLPQPLNVPWILWHWIVNGLLTFFIFKYDKRNSKIKEWRIESEWLYLLSLVGGGFGAWLGRRTSRHKTDLKKEGCFIYFNWTMFALNIVIWLGLFTWQALSNTAT